MITLKTKYPIAECNDHFFPNGTKNDNYSSKALIEELKSYTTFNNLEKFDTQFLLDLGCAGGQFVADCINSGQLAVGLEGSDFNIKRNHPNWEILYNKFLFTCDISEDFRLESYHKLCQFNIISAWELIEHIPQEKLNRLFLNVSAHLSKGGIFIGTISTVKDSIGPVEYHHSVFTESYWKEVLLKSDRVLKDTGLKLVNYPFQNKVRNVPNSFAIALVHENTILL